MQSQNYLMASVAVTVNQNDSCFSGPMEKEVRVEQIQEWVEIGNGDSRFNFWRCDSEGEGRYEILWSTVSPTEKKRENEIK